MTEILDKIGTAFLKILELFKKPTIPEPVLIEEQDITSRPLDERKDFSETLGELLDNLDETFTAYSLSTDTVAGYLDKDELLGLKKLGAHIPNPWQANFVPEGEDIRVPVNGGTMPAMMFIGMALGQKSEGGAAYPDFMFAIKQKKLPWYVEAKAGTPYKFGFGYRLHEKANNKMWWMSSWVVIQADGSVEFCKETRVKDVFIKTGKNAGLHYSQRIRCYSELYESQMQQRNEQGIYNLKNFFRAMYIWWMGRNERWSVSVKSRGDRVTFAVDRLLTKKYFADRNKVINENGRTRRIIHYVKGHDRMRDGKKYFVKEHLRGLSRFNWKGYECTVTAPEFYELPTVMFDGASLEIEKTDYIPGTLISTSKMGLILAGEEDRRAR